MRSIGECMFRPLYIFAVRFIDKCMLNPLCILLWDLQINASLDLWIFDYEISRSINKRKTVIGCQVYLDDFTVSLFIMRFMLHTFNEMLGEYFNMLFMKNFLCVYWWALTQISAPVWQVLKLSCVVVLFLWSRWEFAVDMEQAGHSLTWIWSINDKHFSNLKNTWNSCIKKVSLFLSLNILFLSLVSFILELALHVAYPHGQVRNFTCSKCDYVMQRARRGSAGL